MFRVFRISKMIQESTVDEASKAVMNLAKLMLYLVFYLHCLGCYWWIALLLNSPLHYYLDKDLDRYMREAIGNETEIFEAQ